MALFAATYEANDPEDFNIHSLRAGDAPAMLTFLAAEVEAAIAAGEVNIVDLKLTGAASGLDWECWFVTVPTVSVGALTEKCPLSDARFACAVAGNPVEAREKLLAQLAIILPTTVFKVEVAGSGDGAHYMALALCALGAG